MKTPRLILRYLIIAVVTAIALHSITIAAEKMPAEMAGTIEQPEGNIAFIRDNDIWIMNVDGSGQEKLCHAGNADGRISWSTDNREVMFTRSGLVDTKGPDFMGGKHKLYDLFIASLDSAYANNRQWWHRITDDLGSRDPEWNPDRNNIVFWKDMNANTVNAETPNYQICTMAPDGSDFNILRKDWSNPGMMFLISPSMNSKGDIAAVFFEGMKPIGLVVIPNDSYMISMDTLAAMAKENVGCTAPAWSPDAKWIVFVSNNMDDGSIYITKPDLKEKYLVASPPIGASFYTFSPSFSPDSKWLTFSSTDGSIWICDIAGNGLRRLTGPGLDKAPAWSKKSLK